MELEQCGGVGTGPKRWRDKRRGIPEPPPYDPVAVLEAMRERAPAMYWSMCLDSTKPGVLAHFSTPDGGGTGSHWFPDLPSAVRWLHGQAAAADPAFAEAWPVPAEVKQDG